LLGNPAPPAVGEYADGTPFDLSRRKGSWVVLNFFTHNCVPCIREHPELIQFVDQQRALGADGAEFYSVVRDSTVDEVEAFFEQRGGDWPVVYDTEFEFVNQFGVALVPETWVIDPNGFVRRRIISEVGAEQLSRLLQALREGAA
ncbi:MAG: TlpA family protein disulfide reductase, partial [Ilumatobacter sp.]|nr:TlpA family protein disulfide reductase [Ilumatobacter sp.]